MPSLNSRTEQALHAISQQLHQISSDLRVDCPFRAELYRALASVLLPEVPNAPFVIAVPDDAIPEITVRHKDGGSKILIQIFPKGFNRNYSLWDFPLVHANLEEEEN